MAVDFEDAQKAIETKFSTAWGTTTEVAYDNVDYVPPANVLQWVRLNVLNGATIVAGLAGSANLYRTAGVVVIQIFIKEGEGVRQGLLLADTAAAIFRGTQVDGVLYRAPSIVRVGPSDGWYQVNVNIPFQWDAQF
jgi:hypothetical protein